MSRWGWWAAASAGYDSRTTKATAAGKPPRAYCLVMAPSVSSQPGRSANRVRTSSSERVAIPPFYFVWVIRLEYFAELTSLDGCDRAADVRRLRRRAGLAATPHRDPPGPAAAHPAPGRAVAVAAGHAVDRR